MLVSDAIVVLEGDETGQELLERGLRALAPEVIGLELEFRASTSRSGRGRALRESCLEAVADGVRTSDLGGHTGTTEYTDDVNRRTRMKLEVWGSL